MNTVRQNVVPNNAPRRQMLSNGVLFRFGYQPIVGSGLSKVGETTYSSQPEEEVLREVQQEYCREQGIDEPFIPEDYGY